MNWLRSVSLTLLISEGVEMNTVLVCLNRERGCWLVILKSNSLGRKGKCSVSYYRSDSWERFQEMMLPSWLRANTDVPREIRSMMLLIRDYYQCNLKYMIYMVKKRG
jgi:hypothetical protein